MTLSLKMVLDVDSRAAKARLEEAVRGIKGVTIATKELAGANKTSATATDGEAGAKKRATAAARELAAAQKAEAAAAKEAAAAARKAAADAEAAARKVAAATEATARANAAAMGRASAATGNLAAQFNDIGVMLAAGQNPLQLAIQQGTQISQAFGTAGASGALQLLKQGFLTMLSPVNLITIGAIAAGAAMFQWLTSSGEQARDFATALGDADSAIRAMREATDVLAGTSLGSLAEGYGRVNAQLQEHLAKLQQISQLEAVNATREAMTAVGNDTFGGWLTSDLDDMRIAFGTTNDEAGVLMAMLDQIKSARTFDEQTTAVQAMRAEVESITGGLGNATGGAQAFLIELINAEDAAMRLKVAQEETTTEIENSNAVAGELGAALARAASVNLAAVFSGAIGSANSLLGVTNNIMTRLGAVATAYAKYGPSGVIPGTDIAKGKFSYAGMDGAARAEMAKRPSTIGRMGTGAAGVRSYVSSDGGGGGGGASAAQAEADSLQNLIDKLNGEIAALQTQDPIQKEMLKYRQALAGATDAERKQVEALIIAREKEALAVEGMKASKEFFEQTAVNALDALITKGESLQDVLKGVAAAFLKAAIQGALFGQGPFGALFGGKSILSGLLGGGIPGKADGGMIYGRGTGTSDSEVRALSVGEFVVNAKATARNRHTLEAINAGSSIRGLAGGGMVDSGRRRGSGSYGRDDRPAMVANINLAGARGDREIEAAAERGMKKALAHYDRSMLPTSIKRVSGDPRRTG